jgi:integrase
VKRGRKAEGSAARTRDGRWQPVVTLSDGSRKRVPGVSYATKPEAKAAAVHYAEQAQGLRRKRAAPPIAGAPGAAAEWVAAWLAERDRRGLTSVRENDGHWRVHISPVLGDKPPRDWTAADLRELVRQLDAKVLAGELAWKTACNAWGTATRMCLDACRSKVDALRCRDDDPARDVAGPDRGAKTSKTFLHPSEASAFFECEEVPLSWRTLVAFAIYTYARAGELRVLRWEDVDLEHGTIHVHRAFDRVTRKAKPTKGRKARRYAIEPALMPLVRRMHEDRTSDLVLPFMSAERTMARAFRRWLIRAGVDRRELHHAEATRKAITFHDARASGLTWCAVRGDDPLRIQQRAGHTDFATTQGYIRTAEELRAGFGDVFPKLPSALVKSCANIVRTRPSARVLSGADGTRTRGLRRDRPAL